jgi:hypothetical protein
VSAGPNPRAGLLSAFPDFGFAAVFLITWVRPATFGSQTVKWLLVVMLMEFIIIHSSAFMGTVAFARADRSRRALAILGFGAFYTLFAGAVSLAFRSWWPITTFWGQTVNRLLGVIVGQVPDAERRAFVMRGWGAAVFFYVGGCLATVVLPVPRLGITGEVVAAQHIPGSGLWVEHPEKVIAFGVLYFALTAWSELAGHAWAGKVKAGAPAAG